MKSIKMVDLQGQYLRIKSEIDDAIQEVLTSTAFIQGRQVHEFAAALGNYTGSKHVITCANGTDALQVAMMALGLKPGDEVIVPVFTYVATAEVIALLGLTPVFVDVDPDTFNIDTSGIESCITRKTKAIVPVHLFGQCADMERILKIASQHNLFVIEDAAQALGATFRFSDGREMKAGTMGTIGTTSFFPSKNLGCFGDGGAIFTDDQSLAETTRMVANHGQRVKYYHEVIGVNSRLDTLQAAILQVKLRHLPEYERRRNKVAAFYDTHISNPLIAKPVRASHSSHVFHQYTLQVKNNRRDDFLQYLSGHGIPSMIYYPVPLHRQKAYENTSDTGEYPVSEHLVKAVASIPIHTEMQQEELAYICGKINSFS